MDKAYSLMKQSCMDLKPMFENEDFKCGNTHKFNLRGKIVKQSCNQISENKYLVDFVLDNSAHITTYSNAFIENYIGSIIEITESKIEILPLINTQIQ